MFSIYTERLHGDIAIVKKVLDTHDRLRELAFPPPSSVPEDENSTAIQATSAEAGAPSDTPLTEIWKQSPPKLAWQVYDHCAAFTRLYAVFEQFIEELISEYLQIVSALHSKYEELPVEITKQHRIGIGQILLKLGKDGPFGHLDEKLLIQNLAQALVGGPYKLLPDAFLIETQNYRTDTITKLFSHLGFQNCWVWIERHPSVKSFMDRNRDRTETPATVLNLFVQYRNEAAHTNVTQTVATEEIKSMADCVEMICEALAQLMTRRIVQRREELGQAHTVGTVIHKFSDSIVGVRTRNGKLAVGDEVIALRKYSCETVSVRSIHILESQYESLEVTDNQEIGLKLSLPVSEGTQLISIPNPPSPVSIEGRAEIASPDEPTEIEAIEPDTTP